MIVIRLQKKKKTEAVAKQLANVITRQIYKEIPGRQDTFFPISADAALFDS